MSRHSAIVACLCLIGLTLPLLLCSNLSKVQLFGVNVLQNAKTTELIELPSPLLILLVLTFFGSCGVLAALGRYPQPNE